MIQIKGLKRCLWAVSLTLLAACSFQPKPVVLEPAGSAPAPSITASDEGYLVVYSAWSTLGDSVSHHSRYWVKSNDGKFSKEVLNRIDRFDEGPMRLPLPPGQYSVTARSARFGRVIIPVTIKQLETTSVHIDGSTKPGDSPASDRNEVKLPNGQVVGWAATH